MSEGPVAQAVKGPAVIAVVKPRNSSNDFSPEDVKEKPLLHGPDMNNSNETFKASTTDISLGPSVEEVAMAAASITIADIDNSLTIPTAPLFVMSSEPRYNNNNDNNNNNMKQPLILQKVTPPASTSPEKPPEQNEVTPPTQIENRLGNTRCNPNNQELQAAANMTSNTVITNPKKLCTNNSQPIPRAIPKPIDATKPFISLQQQQATKTQVVCPVPTTAKLQSPNTSINTTQALDQQVKIANTTKHIQTPSDSQVSETNASSQNIVMKPQHIMNMAISHSTSFPPIPTKIKETANVMNNSARTRCSSFTEGSLVGRTNTSSTIIPRATNSFRAGGTFPKSHLLTFSEGNNCKTPQNEGSVPSRYRSNSLPTSILPTTPSTAFSHKNGFHSNASKSTIPENTQGKVSTTTFPNRTNPSFPPSSIIKLPSPLFKPGTLSMTSNDKMVPITLSGKGNTSTTDGKIRTQSFVGKSNESSSYNMAQLHTTSGSDSSNVPIVSSCGSSLQASPAVVTENPVRKMAGESFQNDPMTNENHKCQNRRPLPTTQKEHCGDSSDASLCNLNAQNTLPSRDKKYCIEGNHIQDDKATGKILVPMTTNDLPREVSSQLNYRNNDLNHTTLKTNLISSAQQKMIEHDDSKNIPIESNLSPDSFGNFESKGISFRREISAFLDDIFLCKNSNTSSGQTALTDSTETRPCLLQQSRIACEQYDEETEIDFEITTNQLDTVHQACESVIEDNQSNSTLNDSVDGEDFYKNNKISSPFHHKNLSGANIVPSTVVSSAVGLSNRTLVQGTAAELRFRLKNDEKYSMKSNEAESSKFMAPLVEGTAAAQIVSTSNSSIPKKNGPKYNQYGKKLRGNRNKVVPITNPSMNVTFNKSEGSYSGFDGTKNSANMNGKGNRNFNGSSLKISDRLHVPIDSSNIKMKEQASNGVDSYSKKIVSNSSLIESTESPAMNMLADIISYAPPAFSLSRPQTKVVMQIENRSTNVVRPKQKLITISQTSTERSSFQHQSNKYPSFHSTTPFQGNFSQIQNQKQYTLKQIDPSMVQMKQRMPSVNPPPHALSQPGTQSRYNLEASSGKTKVGNKTSSVGSLYTRISEKMPSFTIGKIRRYVSGKNGFGPWENLTCQSLDDSSSRRWCGLNIDECREILLRRSGRLRIFPNFLTFEKRQSVSRGMNTFNGYSHYEKGLGRKRLYPDPRLHVMLSSKLGQKNSSKRSGSDDSKSEVQPLSLVPEVESLANDVASIYRLPKEEWKIGVDLVRYENKCKGNGWYQNESKGDSFSLCIVTESQGTRLPVLIRLNKEKSLEDGDEEIELWLNEGDAYEMHGCAKAGYEHCLPKQKLDGMRRSLIFLRNGDNELKDDHSAAGRPNVKNKRAKTTNRSPSIHFGHPKREIIEGKAFYSKEFLFETGAHMLDQRGLNGNLREGCDCLLLSKITPSIREQDGLCWLLYTTSRSQGGGALCKSFLRKRPVRVFRSSDLANVYAPETKEEGRTSYRYDGLYSVRVMWDHDGDETTDYPPVGTSLHTFLLTRHPKKTLGGHNEDGIDYNETGVQELWNEIQKSNGVKFPRKFEIPQPPLVLPSIPRCKQDNEVVPLSNDKSLPGNKMIRQSSASNSKYASRNRSKQCRTMEGGYDSSSSSSANNSYDESDGSSSSSSDSESIPDNVDQSSSDGETSDDGSIESSDSTAGISSDKERLQITDSDCSNGRPKRASAAAARNFLHEVMHNRFGDVREERRSPINRSLESRESGTDSTTKNKRKQETNHCVDSVDNSSNSRTKGNDEKSPEKLNNIQLVADKSKNCRNQNEKKQIDNETNEKSDAKEVEQQLQNPKETVELKGSPQNGNEENIIVRESDDESDSYGVDPSSLTVGSRVNVEYRDILYKATIRKSRIKKGKHDFLIHYDGNKKSNVHWISSSKIYEVISYEPQSKKKSMDLKKVNKTRGTQKSKKEKDDSNEANIASRFENGDEVYVDYKDILYLATVKDVKISNKTYDYLIHYDGYKKNSDRWVHESQLHLITASSTRRFNKLRSEKGDHLSGNLEFSDEETVSSSKRKLGKNADNLVFDMGDINPGVAFLPGSCVFVQKQNALYLSKMLKRRRRGRETEYFVEYDCDCVEKTSESWVSLSNVYEINPRTRRIFEKTSERRKLNESREDPRQSKRLKIDAMLQQLEIMGDIPSGVEFLPGSTLFALTEKGLHLAKMLKKRGRGDNMEYYIQFNGVKDAPEIWVPVSHVYEINPQTKRMFNKQRK